jgi:hypothetical protein
VASCRACGAAVGNKFRFCSQCGRAVNAEVELLDLAPVVSQEAVVQRGRSGRFWTAAAGGLLAVALGAWLLGRGGADDASGEAAPGDRPTTTRPSGNTADDATADSDRSGTDGPSTTRRPRSTTVSTTGMVGDGAPLLGEPTGLSLVYGTESSVVRQLDLDTGLVTQREARGWPMAVTGRWLVLLNPSGGTVEAVPFDDPEAEPSRISRPGGSPMAALAGPEPGQVWISEYGPEGAIGRLVRIEDGAVLEEVALFVGSYGWYGTMLDPTLSGSPSGGIFEWSGGSYRRVSEAQLLAASDEVLLTQTCGEPAQCTLQWLDRRTFEPVDRLLPALEDRPSPEGSPIELSPGGRVMAYYSADGPRVFDVVRGQQLPSQPGTPSLAASPDGRYVAWPEGSRIAIYDTETGESHYVDPALVSQDVRLQFAPTPGE